MSFGYALKKFREGRSLTLRELGKLCEINHTYIHRLEKEERTSPSEETVDSLIRTLKLDKRKARILRFLVGQTVSGQLIEVFLEDGGRPVEFFESLAFMSFRGKRPKTKDEWRKWAELLEEFIMVRDRTKRLEVILKARDFIRESRINSVPVDFNLYSAAAKAEIKVCYDLNDEESGQTFSLDGRNIIIVNGNHTEERQRFTILHEISHIILDLPSEHQSDSTKTTKTADLMSYKQRPEEEVLCDIFAAECLLPYDFFKKDIEDVDICLDTIKKLSKRYRASIHSTGSRFAANCEGLCSFVLIEEGKIRYVSSSKSLRKLKGWIGIGAPVPKKSVAFHLIKNQSEIDQYDNKIPTKVWFKDGVGNYDKLCEEAIFIKEWNQCLSILWFDESSKTTGEI